MDEAEMNGLQQAWPIVLSLVLPVGFLYGFLILFFYVGWKKISPYRLNKNTPKKGISIIIPLRNEEVHLYDLISDLKQQNYSKASYEVILVNDHSTDRSAEILRTLIAKSPFMHLTDNSGKGKKQAILHGVALSRFDFIVTSDADCRRGKDWLAAFAGFLEENQARMILGPVLSHKTTGFAAKAKALEFLSLVSSGAGAARMGHPILANGANLGFYKDDLNFDKDPLKKEIPSGDDLFLMLRVKKNNPQSIFFLKSTKAAVYTDLPGNWRDFFHQRIRWVSKSRFYRDFDLLFTAFTVLGINLLLLVLLVAGFISRPYFIGFFILWLLKLFPDVLMLSAASRFFHKEKLMRAFLPLQLFYFIYVSITAFAGLTGTSYEWKGRKFGRQEKVSHR